MIKMNFSIKTFVVVLLAFMCSSMSFAADVSANNILLPTPLKSLQLNQPFTIKYSASTEGYDNGIMDRNRLLITLSYNGKVLLYRGEDMHKHFVYTVLYDGRDTYEVNSNSRIAQIEPGFDFDRMPFCPLPGVGIPYMPLFIQGLPVKLLSEFQKQAAPAQSSEKNYIDKTLYNQQGQIRDYATFCYINKNSNTRSPRSGLASAVSILSEGSPKVLWFDTFDNIGPNLGNIWEFYSHQKFQGVWIARKFKMRWYGTLGQTHKNVLLQDATYKLESAFNGTLGASDYDPCTYLPAQANITDTTTPTVRAFVYQVGKGSLQMQRQAGVELSRELAVDTKSKTNSGLIGLISIAAITVIWFVWRRKQGV